MKMNGSGCVFDNYGRVPETLYSPGEQSHSAIEKAVFHNQPKEVLAAIEVKGLTFDPKPISKRHIFFNWAWFAFIDSRKE